MPMTETVDIYSTTYANFASDLRARLRVEVFGEDIGQHSWTTADEQRHFARLAGFGSGTTLLEIGCGAGGPALFLARSFDLRVTGVDINQNAIAMATARAREMGLSENARFLLLDGSQRLPFDDGSFEAVCLFDAINHIPTRPLLLKEVARLLKPDGKLLFTDPVVVTGPVSAIEIAARSAIGHFEFVPDGINEKLLADAGFRLLVKEDRTANAAMVSGNWVRSRAKWRDELIASEGVAAFEQGQAFYAMVHTLSESRRLSRILYLAQRIG